MTRINSAIPVKNLTDEHLLAEHREIKRLPSCYIISRCSGSINNIPETFQLGKGHVTFFLNKQKFLFNRYIEIHNECLNRGFKVLDYTDNWIDNIRDMSSNGCWENYTPTKEEHDLLVNRISQRINDSSKGNFHYYGKCITKEQAIELLTKE